MTKVAINEPFASRGTHTSVEVKAETITVELDARQIGDGPAHTIRDAIARGIRGITELASAATLRRRKAEHPPSSRTALFNDSGRLASGLGVNAAPDGSWNVTAPPDRLDPSKFRDLGAFERMMLRMRELVPALRDPTLLPEVRRAIEESLRKALKVRR